MYLGRSRKPTMPQICLPMGKRLAYIEKLYIERTMQMFKGDERRAARSLGISPKIFHMRLSDYGYEYKETEQPEQSLAEDSISSA